MKFNATYGDLFGYSSDLNDFAIQHPAVSKMLAQGYRKFEMRNKVHLTILRKKLAELYEENVRMEDGKPQVVKNEHGEITGFDYKSSEHEKSFNEAWQELMSRNAQIIIGE